MNAISGTDDQPQTELVIGLVNNMPAQAAAAADRQFYSLLEAAAPGRRIRLRRFAPGPTPAGPPPAGYDPVDMIWQTSLDGLIVTGAEPHTGAMTDEPAWNLLARLVDWAAEHTKAAIWSCLAAHAAAFHLDGIKRRRLPQKLSGVFPCRRAAVQHPLLDDAPPAWLVPHSRWNDLDAAELERAGYTILSQSPEPAGADAFAKPVGNSLFLMLQGHPEYTADTLLREYRRDLRRWLAGADRPATPTSYFDLETEIALTRSDDPVTSLNLLEAAPDPAPHWRDHSVRLYQNWLAALPARALAEAGLSTR